MEKTFRQHGRGYEGKDTVLQVFVNDKEVFSGSIKTVDDSMPVRWDYNYKIEDIAFIWTLDHDFTGTVNYKISVVAGCLILADLVCNNPLRKPEVFMRGIDAEEKEGHTYLYPYVTDIKVNTTVFAPVSPTPWWCGQGWFQLYSGDVYTATVHTRASEPWPPRPKKYPADRPWEPWVFRDY